MEQNIREYSIFERVVHGFLFLFIFIILAGTIFFGVKWFSDSVGAFFFGNHQGKNVFSGDLEASASSAVKVSNFSKSATLPRNWEVSDLVIDAPAGLSMIVQGSGQQVLFGKNQGKKLPVASLTKLMTALIVLEKYDLDQKVVISDAAMLQEGEQGVLQPGQVMTVKDLLYITLMESSNRAAYALAEQMGIDHFVGLMNGRAQELNLNSTHFADSTGLDSGSYSTAQDLAQLSVYLFKNAPLFREIVGLREFDLYLPDGTFHHRLINTNKLLGMDNIIGGKTGFTDNAKGCFMTIQNGPEQGSYLINIVLGADDRFSQMKNIIDWTAMAYQWQ